MPSKADVREIDQEGKPQPKRRFDQRDFEYIAEFLIDEWERRKRSRTDRERQWKEIDRQIAMEPDISFKKLPNGKIDTKKAWMAEMELPLQAQALEVLTADARRMMFPDQGPWFRAHGEMTDAYLAKVDFQSFILGDETEVPSRINQDNCDKLIEGFLLHLFGQCDIYTRFDMLNAETFKYGMGVGRARMETKNVWIHEARGTRSEKQRIPVIVPCSIKTTYLDDPMPSMHSAQMLGPLHIVEDHIKFASLVLACEKGSSDPDNEDGGWMSKNVGSLEPDDDGYVHIIETEGDIVLPRKTTRSMVIPGAIVTVAIGGKTKGGDVTRAVVRFRFRQMPFSSFILFPYHYEHVDDPYPTSPLMKGRPIQIAATDALNRLMDSAALKNQPPVGYDRNDQVFAVSGGPAIYPAAQWGTTDPITVYDKVGGDPGALLAVYTQAIRFYAEFTGVLPARLGAQSVSHTTAFSKNAELERGAVRTVDYVRQAGKGPIERWLDMAYAMGRKAMKSSEDMTLWIDAYGGFVSIDRESLPERASFEWFGSGGPAEEQAKSARKLNSLQLSLKADQLNVSMGGKPTVDVPAAIKEILREGGWTDIDSIVLMETAVAQPGAAGGPLPTQAALRSLTEAPE
jgi:hypothetical protein